MTATKSCRRKSATRRCRRFLTCWWWARRKRKLARSACDTAAKATRAVSRWLSWWKHCASNRTPGRSPEFLFLRFVDLEPQPFFILGAAGKLVRIHDPFTTRISGTGRSLVVCGPVTLGGGAGTNGFAVDRSGAADAG